MKKQMLLLFHDVINALTRTFKWHLCSRTRISNYENNSGKTLYLELSRSVSFLFTCFLRTIIEIFMQIYLDK